MMDVITISKLVVGAIMLLLAKVWFVFNYNKLLRRAPIPRSFKKYIIGGQDRHFVMEPHEEPMNYPVIKFTFERPHNSPYNFIVDTLRPVIDSKDSRLRINVDACNKHTYFYSTEPTDAIIRYTFSQVKSIHGIDKTVVAHQAALNPNKCKFIIATDGFAVCCSHLLHDGVSIFNLLTTFTGVPSLKLREFTYVPLINEAYMLKSALLTMTHLHDVLAIKRHIKHLVPWNSGFDESTLVKSAIPIRPIKTIKSTLQQNGTPLPFPVVFSAIQTMGMFYASNAKKLSIGVSVGFKNTNRFNNFTLIVAHVDRPVKVITKNNFRSSTMSLLRQIHKQLDKTQHLVQSMYSITNVYNVDTYLNDHLDVLYSGIPMCLQDQHHFDGVNIENVCGTMPCHTTPAYVLFLSDTNTAFTTQHIRSNDINVAQLNYFNECLPDWLSA